MTTVVAPGPTEATHGRWARLAIAAAIGLAILVLPTPSGLSTTAHAVVAIASFTILLWMLNVLNNGVASVLMMGLLVLAGVKPPLALSGFSSPQFWILLAVLYYGLVMQNTGLAERLAYHILDGFPATYPGILTAFFAIGLVLALGIPSMTVRTAIMVPIAWALTRSLGLAPRSRGAALIVLTTVEMAVIPGCAFLYGSLFGPVVESLFRAKELPLSWLSYARVMTVPTMLLCAVVLAGNYALLRPGEDIKVSTGFVRERLRALGPIKGSERLVAVLVLLSIAFWATDRLHHLPSFLVGMMVFAVFSLTGLVRDGEIGSGISWPLLLFLGGIFSLANVLQEYRITDWLATFIVPLVMRLTFSPFAIVATMAGAMMLMRFLDPTGFIALAVLFLSMTDVFRGIGLPPMVLVAALVIAAVPFWASYQNIWVAMGEGLTGNAAFSPAQRIRLANVYAVAVVLTLVASVAFWKLIGVF